RWAGVVGPAVAGEVGSLAEDVRAPLDDHDRAAPFALVQSFVEVPDHGVVDGVTVLRPVKADAADRVPRGHPNRREFHCRPSRAQPVATALSRRVSRSAASRRILRLMSATWRRCQTSSSVPLTHWLKEPKAGPQWTWKSTLPSLEPLSACPSACSKYQRKTSAILCLGSRSARSISSTGRLVRSSAKTSPNRFLRYRR